MVDQKYLKESLDYDPLTGEFTWRLDRPESHFKDWRGKNGWMRNMKDDLVAGYIAPVTKRNPRPYKVIGLKGKLHKAHRLAWLYEHGQWPEGDIDHINQDTLDNRIDNLRISVDQMNHKNRSLYSKNTSGLSGVTWHKRTSKWQAEGQRTIEGKRIRYYLGLFESFLDACSARKSWENDNGYSANHGKPRQ